MCTIQHVWNEELLEIKDAKENASFWQCDNTERKKLHSSLKIFLKLPCRCLTKPFVPSGKYIAADCLVRWVPPGRTEVVLPWDCFLDVLFMLGYSVYSVQPVGRIVAFLADQSSFFLLLGVICVQFSWELLSPLWLACIFLAQRKTLEAKHQAVRVYQSFQTKPVIPIVYLNSKVFF